MSADSSILRSLGLMLQKEEAGTKRPVAVRSPLTPALSPGVGEGELQFVCAWCQRERGEVPLPNQSHGICERHAALMRREIADRLRVKLAA